MVPTKLSEDVPAWNQLAGETTEAWGSFQTWLLQKPRGAIKPDQEKYSRQFLWAERAMAYDAHQEASKIPDAKKGAMAAKNLVKVLFWETVKLLTASEVSTTPLLTPRDLLALLEYTSKDSGLRKLLDENDQDLSKVSAEDLEKINQILKKRSE